MRTTIGSLAFLAVAGPALAIPGFNRGEAVKEFKHLEEEIEKLEELKGSWSGHGRQGGRPGSYPWAGASSAEASPVTGGTASSTISAAPYGTWTPTGYWNASATAKPYWGNSTYGGSDSSDLTTYVTVTDIVSYYTTVCPYESEYTSGSDVLTTTSGLTTSTVETTIHSTITITTTVPTAPAYGSGSDETSSPVSPVSSDSPAAPGYGSSDDSSSDLNTVGYVATDSYATHLTATSDDSAPTTILPVPYGTYTPSGYEASSGFAAHPSGYEHPDTYTTVYVTSVVTESVYTSKCHETTTQTSGSSTLTSTYDTVSTLTSTLTSTFETTLTVTVASGSSTPAGPVTGSGSPSAPAYGDSPSATSGSPVTVGSSSHPHASAPGHYGIGSYTHHTGYPSHESSSSGPKPPVYGSSSSSPAGPATGSSTVSASTGPSAPAYGASSSSPVGTASGSSTGSASTGPSAPVYGGSSSTSGGPTAPVYGGSSSTSGGPTAPVYGGSSSTSGGPTAPVYGGSSSTSAGPTPPVYGDSSSSASSTSPVSPITDSSSTSETSYSTYTTNCTESGVTTIHTHSAPISGNGTSSAPAYPTSYGTGSVPAYPTSYGTGSSSSPAGPVGTGSSPAGYPSGSYPIGSGSSSAGYTTGSSSSPAGPVGTGSSPAGYPSGSYPIGTGSSSSPAGPIGTGSAPAGYPSGSYPVGTGSSPAGYPTGSYPVGSGSVTGGYPTGSYSASVSVTSSYGGSNGTSSTVSGPITGSSSSSSTSETSYTTFETTCTENGTTTIHTHSQPITEPTSYSGNSTAVGPTGTGSVSSPSGYPSGYPTGYPGSNSTVVGPTGTGSYSSPSGYPSGYPTGYPDNSTVVGPTGTGSYSSPSGAYPTGSYPAHNITTPTAGPTGTGSVSSSSSSESKYTTYTTTCTENGTSVIHTHSAPITGNATSLFPTSPVTQSESSSTPYPAGNTTTSAPGSTGTSPSTTSSSTSSAEPSHTGCVPCKGQPGDNPGRGVGGYCGYTAADNQYEVLPKTCETREFFFEITNTTIAPDGIERMALVINNQMPGPLIEANWGDTIVVHVKNSMQNNGTTIHWHGQRQNYTNEMDGVASITQCPIAPGEEMTYTFTAANYGFSWYHSHVAIQTYEGVFGPMLIHGPKSTQEEYDEEVIVLQDWSHVPVDQMYDAAQTVGPRPQNGPRTLDTGLINGVNVWGDDATGSGERWSMDVTKGQTKLLRLVNTAIQSTFVFSIDSHKMKVIAMDYVPIVPYETDTIYINNGQRYDVLVTFDQEEDNYWLRSDNQDECATITEAFNIKGIVHYSGVEMATPTSATWSYTAGCKDEPLESLVPYYAIDAGVVDETINERVLIGGNSDTPSLYKWTLNQVTFTSEWGHPTLESIVENGTIPDYSGNLAIEAKELGEWVYIIIDSPIPFPHPIHLHGHDFFVLAQGTGVYTPAVTLNLENPPRRDVAMMPWNLQAGLGGHLVVAFKTDNPGVWLMHCHIGWHVAMGFALQIIENLEGIKDTVKETQTMSDTCTSYNAWAEEYGIVTLDSGV